VSRLIADPIFGETNLTAQALDWLREVREASMGGSKKAVNPPFGSLSAGPRNGLGHIVGWQAAGLSITEHPR
jgi:hypothetical protein